MEEPGKRPAGREARAFAAARKSIPGVQGLRDLALRRLDQLILAEIERARPRVRRLRKAHPGVSSAELVPELVTEKRSQAGTGGMVSGALGLAGVPADLILVSYLQLSLAVEIALLYGVNLKSRAGQQEVVDIVARGNGAGPLVRGGAPVLARLALSLLRRRGFPSVGRAVPVLAMPMCAYLNHRDIERVAREAVRHYDGLRRLAARRRARR